MIIIENVAKNYEDGVTVTHALKGISLKIESGEFTAIMGPSGSGKSTLLHILSFLDRPSSGKYVFFGKSIEDLSDSEVAAVRNQEMGFIFQSFNLLLRSTVYENIEIPLLYNRTPSKIRPLRIKKAVKSVGLLDKIDTEAGRLSGGQKQRVAIARALVNEPNVIFADEPTGNLDSESGSQIMEILDELNKEGRTIILVTHETYTSEFASRIITLKDGILESDIENQKRRHQKKDFIK